MSTDDLDRLDDNAKLRVTDSSTLEILRVDPEGRITLADGLTPDDAARAIGEALARMNVGALAALREARARVEALEAAEAEYREALAAIRQLTERAQPTMDSLVGDITRLQMRVGELEAERQAAIDLALDAMRCVTVERVRTADELRPLVREYLRLTEPILREAGGGDG